MRLSLNISKEGIKYPNIYNRIRERYVKIVNHAEDFKERREGGRKMSKPGEYISRI